LAEDHDPASGAPDRPEDTAITAAKAIPKTKRQRQALQRRAVRQAWSVRQLQAAIARQFLKRGDGGRQPPIPADLDDFLVRLETMCEVWRARQHRVG
jgi:hypothetical protein